MGAHGLSVCPRSAFLQEYCCHFLRHAVALPWQHLRQTFHGIPRNVHGITGDLPRTGTAYHGTTLTLTLTLGRVEVAVAWGLPGHAVALPWSAVGVAVAVATGVATYGIPRRVI